MKIKIILLYTTTQNKDDQTAIYTKKNSSEKKQSKHIHIQKNPPYEWQLKNLF